MKTARISVWVAAVLGPLLLALPARAGSGGEQGPSLEGSWLGTLKVSSTISLRVVFYIRAKPDGSFSGTFVSLDQSLTPRTLDRIGLQNGRVMIDVNAIGGRYEGILNAEGSTIGGKWTQRGGVWDLPLRRRPQEPKRPYPYLDEEVTYSNVKDGVTLAGTLTLPPAGGPFPAVILITGSGPEDRDESLFGHRPFLVLADYLTRRGIVVLRVDDRGVGGSQGDTSQATSEDFARDVLAGAEYLKTRREIDPKWIGLIGHSDGGAIAPLAAIDSNDVAFIVLMAAPGVAGDLLLEGQLAALMKADGADQAAIDAALQEQRRIMGLVKSETDPNRARDRLRALGYPEAQVQSWTSKWFYFFITHDPQETLHQVRCPVLALNGTLDLQVVAQVNLPAIEQALREGGNPDFTVKELPGLNHLFQTAQTGRIDEYARIDETLSPVALEIMAAWIEARTKPK